MLLGSTFGCRRGCRGCRTTGSWSCGGLTCFGGFSGLSGFSLGSLSGLCSFALSARSSSGGLSLSRCLSLSCPWLRSGLLSRLWSTSADGQTTCTTKGNSSVSDCNLAFFESL